MHSRVIALVVLSVALCLAFGFVVDYAVAQDSEAAKNVDRELQSRRGVSGSLAPVEKKEKDGEGPTQLQMALGVGSVFVLIAVWKWL